MPFFLEDAAFAVGRGRGDVCAPLETTQRFWHVVATPPVSLATAEVYQHLRAAILKAPPQADAWQPQTRQAWEAISRGDTATVNRACVNQLTETAQRLCREIAPLADSLRRAGASAAHLSGSGPTAFTVHATEAEARDVCAQWQQSGAPGQCLVARTAE